ncbi:ABC transporter I family member 1 [Tanacetum coccineum]
MSRGPPLPRLLFNNVSCMRNAQQILRHTNISIHDGGALVLTGANGSGKSTFLRMLAGFSKPSAGEILWNGHDVTEVYGARAIANEKARMLSMGQRKRLQLARVIAMDRPIWLLEPLVALVDEGVKLLEQMIADRRSQGGIVIVATHLPIQIENAMFLRLPPRFPRRITLVDMLPH